MASDLADRLRAGLEEFNRTGVIPSGFYAPDFELHQSSSIVDTQGVFRGTGAVLIHTRGRGRASGMVIENHIAWVWTFRDGLAIRMVVHEDQAEALAAAGIEP
jgi:ketosteroid isomerase-like protein